MTDWDAVTAPDAARIEAMARSALAGLPPEFREAAAQVALRVAEFAPEDVLDELQIDDPFELPAEIRKIDVQPGQATVVQ